MLYIYLWLWKPSVLPLTWTTQCHVIDLYNPIYICDLCNPYFISYHWPWKTQCHPGTPFLCLVQQIAGDFRDLQLVLMSFFLLWFSAFSVHFEHFTSAHFAHCSSHSFCLGIALIKNGMFCWTWRHVQTKLDLRIELKKKKTAAWVSLQSLFFHSLLVSLISWLFSPPFVNMSILFIAFSVILEWVMPRVLTIFHFFILCVEITHR
jgi:hypothetical protein